LVQPGCHSIADAQTSPPPSVLSSRGRRWRRRLTLLLLAWPGGSSTRLSASRIEGRMRLAEQPPAAPVFRSTSSSECFADQVAG
jgi:hypothetical protein